MEKLGIDLWGLLWQAVAFGVLVFGLYKLLYRPTLRMLDERAQRIRQGLADADRARRRLEEAEREYVARLEEASREGQRKVSEATQAAQRLRDEILTQARQEAAALIMQARQQIEAEQRQALEEVRAHIAELAVEAARRVVRASLDEEAQRRLVEEFLADEMRQ